MLHRRLATGGSISQETIRKGVVQCEQAVSSERYLIVVQIIEGRYDGHHPCVLPCHPLDALEGVWRVVFHIGQVIAWFQPPCLVCTAKRFPATASLSSDTAV